jgi:SAM-dependent methyltransferase
VVYNAIASIYDRIMSHVQYDHWLELVRHVVERHGRDLSPSILEIGGGTGVLGAKFLAAGYDYRCSDLSFGMCREAHRRHVPTVCADGRHLPFKNGFDLVIFLYDGINYLQNADEYRTLFSSVHDRLNPYGLFLFDVTTQTNSMRYFTDHMDFEDFGDSAYVRHSYYESRGDMQHNHFTVFSAIPGTPGHFQRTIEHHAQKLYSISALRKMVPRDLFSIVGVWDGYTFDPANAESERVHFLLRRNPAP